MRDAPATAGAAATSAVSPGREHLRGAGYLFAAYFLYAVGDAAAKWLVGSLPVWQILFFRSWLGVALCLAISPRATLDALQRIGQSRRLFSMNLANFCGWAAYYSAAAYLPLPQLYTIYYLSPIVAALLAGPMLGERIASSSWMAGALGFVGVLITTAPAHSALPALLPATLGITAALMWSLSAVLYRRNMHGSANLDVLIFSSIAFGALSSVPLALTWRAFDLRQAGILAIVAVAGLAAHYLYINGVRRVAVAVAGPISFFSIIWTALLAYFIWGDLPQPRLLLGGALIFMAGLLIIGSQWRRSRGAAA
jgi:drug/metabolite transporter (DMT)-like permease